MLTNGVVTVFRPKAPDGDFERVGTFPAWFRRKRRLKNIRGGVYFCDDFDLRIKLGLVDSIESGDLVYFGELAQSDFSVEKCRKVAAVTQNCFGTNPHWHLEAEYQYR